MIVLTKRQKEILDLLSIQNDYITFNLLAKKLSVSNRTIRNDMKQIEFFLMEKGIELVKKAGVGILLSCDESEKSAVRRDVDRLYKRSFSKMERNSLIKIYLCLHTTSTFQDLADICFVCRQTIINSFDAIVADVGILNVKVEKIQGVGLQLSGSEIDIRRMFMQTLNDNPCPNEIDELLSNNKDIQRLNTIAEEIFEQLDNNHDISFKDTKCLKRFIAFVLLRVESEYLLSKDFNFPDFPHDSLNFFMEFLTPYLASEKERIYLSTIMISERMSQLSDLLYSNKNEDDEAYQIAMFLVDSLQALQPLEKESVQEMIDGLTLHLKTAIHRCRNNLKVKNDLVDQTQMMISLFYEFTRKQLHQVEKQYNLSFDENEIAYIAMYIASIYEIGSKERNMVNVLLICSFGLATSSILKSRLSQFLPELAIMGPVSEKQAMSYLESNKVDLIISTNEYVYLDIPVIRVNPMLNQIDIERIKSKLYQFSYSKMCSSFINSVAPTIQRVEKRYLKDYIDEEYIQIVDEVSSWEEAIQIAAKPLLEKQYIEQQYVETMIYAVNEYGTYMVMTPQTAYVHAGEDDGIYQNCTAILILRNPIMFGYMNPKLVRTIVILGIKNKQDNDLLNIAYILEKEWNIEKLESDTISKEIVFHMYD